MNAASAIPLASGIFLSAPDVRCGPSNVILGAVLVAGR
jgi:hypothetical protein